MSVVIVGGHDRMVHQYKKICKQYKCKAKVFTQMSGSLKEQIGSPTLLVSVRLESFYWILMYCDGFLCNNYKKYFHMEKSVN